MSHNISELRKAAAATVEQLSFRTPEFTLDIGWAQSYDDLFSGNVTQSDEAAILETVFRKGRCIVVGRGGGGKTQLLHRLFRAAAHDEAVCILIDLKNWTKSDYGAWNEWTASDIRAGASFLFERFSQPRVDAIGLDYLPPSTQKLVIVDGLNEINALVGHQILLALDTLVRDQIGLSILVADRLTRRVLPSPSRWALAMVLPLGEKVIVQHCGAEALKAIGADSLRSPYFLDAAIRKQEVTESPSETHHRFLRDHGGLEEAELNCVASAAYRLYQDAGTRTFPFELLIALVGPVLAKRLQDNGVVVSAGQAGEAQFAHHLLHDYLAARHVAGLPSNEWTRGLLQTLSFDGASFDTISMVLSQLQEEAADAFLRSLYDWNPYAAAYALTDTHETVLGPSIEMQHVIFAMLAEKRFDLVEPTKQRASDALAIIHAPSATELKASKTKPELLATVGRMKSDREWFKEWAALFVTPPEGSISDRDIERIREPDSIYGWTVANVARRVKLTDQQLQNLRAWLSDQGPVVRWRIAHVLGAHPSNANANALETLLKGDPDLDVRYGAVRSLVEVAAETEDEHLRQAVGAILINVAPALAPQRKLKEELRRALLVVPEAAPASWWEIIAAVSKSGYMAEDDLEEREVWKRFVDLASARYTTPSGA